MVSRLYAWLSNSLSLLTHIYSARLLQLSLPLVKTYGFSRETLARSALCLDSSDRAHAEPLSDTAVSALFGPGDEARRTLIEAWLKEGLRSMENPAQRNGEVSTRMRDALRARLEYNEPVLGHLSEVFLINSSPRWCRSDQYRLSLFLSHLLEVYPL